MFYRTRPLPLWMQSILIRSNWLQTLLYRYRCPYPVLADRSARACCEAECCGCDNATRYKSGREAASNF